MLVSSGSGLETTYSGVMDQNTSISHSDSPEITDEMVERLAVHLVNDYRAITDTPPLAALDDLSDFAQGDWRRKARKLLAAAFGSSS